MSEQPRDSVSLLLDVHAAPPADRTARDAAEWEDARSRAFDSITGQDLLDELADVSADHVCAADVILAAVKSGSPLAAGRALERVLNNYADRLADREVYGSACSHRVDATAAASHAVIEALSGGRRQ